MPRRHAFTLIELLVVISIIALLVSILLPALGRARDAGRAAVCMSNQRQTTLALLMYTDDFEGRFAIYAASVPGGLQWWFGLEPGYPNGGWERPLDKSGSPLAPYFGGDIQEGLACPAFPRNDPRFKPKFAESSAHFGYNGGLFWPGSGFSLFNRRPRAMREVVQPSGVAAFADAVHQDFGASFYEPHELAYRRPGYVSGATHYRHDRRANVALLDGHVRRIERPASETIWDTIAGAEVANLDTGDGPGTLYGFPTWTSQ